MKRNKLLYGIGNEEGDGLFIYLVPKEKRRYHDLYLLKIRGSIKKNSFDLYMQEREALEIALVLLAGVSVKKKIRKEVD